MWEQLFGVANLIAMSAWIVLLLAPRKPVVMKALFYGPVLLLAISYSAGLVGVLSGMIPTGNGDVDFSTINGVRSIFASDAGVTIGWVHYLAFDLFVGIWIARNADALGLNDLKGRIIQAPILFLTFMAGPLGLLLYLMLRFVLNTPENHNRIPA
jgi:hypothetical protein